MSKNKKFGCLSLLLLSPLTMAMQPLDDQSLSASTAQDGLTMGIQLNAGVGKQNQILFNQLSMIDTDGLSYGEYTSSDGVVHPAYTSDYGTRAGLILAAKPGGDSLIGIKFNGTSTATTLKVVMDTDGGTTASGGAFSNMAVSFGNGITGFSLLPFSIYLTNASNLSTLTGTNYSAKSIFSSGTTLNPGVQEILRISGIDVAFMAGNSPTMNIQLGAAPQGHMVMFGGAISSICGTGDGCNMMLVSNGSSATNPIGIGFDLQLKATNGFGLSGFYAGVESKGLVFGNAGTTDPFNLNINNIKLGNTADIGQFNGLGNGSIGNIGMVGTTVSNLKMNVSGM